MLLRAFLGLCAAAGAAAAQVPGAPVLQNAFANPGIAVAANFGAGSGQSFYGAAGAWGLSGGKLQISGAAGVARGNGSTRGAYGARASASVWTSSGGGLAAGAFAGVGGAPSTRLNGVVNNAAILNIPAGVSLGYRHAFGSRGVSAYASPFYRWTRADAGDATSSSGSFRVGLGADVGLSSSLGLTVGGELGGRTAADGGTGVFGVAVTFVPGRR